MKSKTEKILDGILLGVGIVVGIIVISGALIMLTAFVKSVLTIF